MTGKNLAEIIVSKHPAPMQLSVEVFRQYEIIPTLMNINITADIVEQVDKAMQVMTRLAGIDSDTW